MYHITLANGKSFDVVWCGESNGFLYAELVTKHSISEIAAIFSDEEATKQITYAYGGFESVYEQYTKLLSITTALQNGNLTVCLSKNS